MKNRIIYIVWFSMVILACSKEGMQTPIENPGSEVPRPNEEPVLTGVFKDALVEGLSYGTPSQSGKTNEKGEFLYKEGETVIFKVGDILLGEVEAAPLITPIDLVQKGNKAITNPEAKNMAAFLQTLDSDADHGNGITLLAEVVDAISITSIDFGKPIASLLAQLVTEVSQKTEVELLVVLPEQATIDMALALGMAYTIEDYTQTHFLPFIEAFFSNSPKARIVTHIYDDKGKILSSEIRGRYTGRLMGRWEYSGHNGSGLPASMLRISEHPLTDLDSIRYWFGYNDQNQVMEIEVHNETKGILLREYEITEWNEKNQMVFFRYDYTYQNEERQLIQRNHYDEEGYLIKKENILDENNPLESTYTNEYTYDQWGNVILEYRYDNFLSSDETARTTFIYRDDHTLESSIRKHYETSAETNLKFSDFFEYDEEEFLVFIENRFFTLGSILQKTYTKGILITQKSYQDGTLTTEWVFPIGENKYTKTVFTAFDDYTYWIEYYEKSTDILLKIEYYDENDELLRTQYPEDSGKRAIPFSQSTVPHRSTVSLMSNIHYID